MVFTNLSPAEKVAFFDLLDESVLQLFGEWSPITSTDPRTGWQVLCLSPRRPIRPQCLAIGQ